MTSMLEDKVGKSLAEHLSKDLIGTQVGPHASMRLIFRRNCGGVAPASFATNNIKLAVRGLTEREKN